MGLTGHEMDRIARERRTAEALERVAGDIERVADAIGQMLAVIEDRVEGATITIDLRDAEVTKGREVAIGAFTYGGGAE